MTHSQDGDLFLEEDHAVGDDLLLEVEMLDTDCFYGRSLGFQVDMLLCLKTDTKQQNCGCKILDWKFQFSTRPKR